MYRQLDGGRILTSRDLQRQIKKVCIEITHEASDSRLARAEVFEYLTVVNSAAQISAGLETRIEKYGIAKAQSDIFRFASVAFGKIQKIRSAVALRNEAPD